MKDMFGPAEGSFGVDHPVLAEHRPQESMEGFLLAEPFQAVRKKQLPVTESVLEAGHELAAKYATQNLNRQEKRIARVYPALVIGRETTRRDHAVNMRMVASALTIP
jgi:hypothetical protein